MLMLHLRRLAALVILASVVVVPAVAFADDPPPDGTHEAEHKFPMAATEFRAHIAARIERHRSKMEEHIAARQLPKERADEVRARFAAGVAQINAKVDAACADGTVTREEAMQVRELARSLMGHHGGEGQQK
jgi:pyruvate kinase